MTLVASNTGKLKKKRKIQMSVKDGLEDLPSLSLQSDQLSDSETSGDSHILLSNMEDQSSSSHG